MVIRARIFQRFRPRRCDFKCRAANNLTQPVRLGSGPLRGCSGVARFQAIPVFGDKALDIIAHLFGRAGRNIIFDLGACVDEFLRGCHDPIIAGDGRARLR
jgi:hypothetical protein